MQRLSSIQRLSLRSENAVHVKADAGVTEAKALDRHVHWIQVPAFHAHTENPARFIIDDC